MPSSHLRSIGKIELGVPLASAAISTFLTASKGSPFPKYIALSDTTGRIHLFDTVGRPLAAPIEPDAGMATSPDGLVPGPGPGPVVVAFGAKEPAALFAAVGSVSNPTGFVFHQYRIVPEARPQPGSRMRLALAKSAAVSWKLPQRPPPRRLPRRRPGRRRLAGRDDRAERRD